VTASSASCSPCSHTAQSPQLPSWRVPAGNDQAHLQVLGPAYSCLSDVIQLGLHALLKVRECSTLPQLRSQGLMAALQHCVIMGIGWQKRAATALRPLPPTQLNMLSQKFVGIAESSCKQLGVQALALAPALSGQAFQSLTHVAESVLLASGVGASCV
jgi:hypothetical protein